MCFSKHQEQQNLLSRGDLREDCGAPGNSFKNGKGKHSKKVAWERFHWSDKRKRHLRESCCSQRRQGISSMIKGLWNGDWNENVQNQGRKKSMNRSEMISSANSSMWVTVEDEHRKMEVKNTLGQEGSTAVGVTCWSKYDTSKLEGGCTQKSPMSYEWAAHGVTLSYSQESLLDHVNNESNPFSIHFSQGI